MHDISSIGLHSFYFFFFLQMITSTLYIFFFFLNDPAPPEFSTLPLPAALPISAGAFPEVVGAGHEHDRAVEPLHEPRRDDPDHAFVPAFVREHVAAAGPPSLRPRLHLRERLRSEEHTSELQSQSNLVCRLLLEK